jgi:hypothetical protein
MNQVKQSIETWTGNNNVIDPDALANIRKHVLSSYIINVPGGAEAAEKVAKQSAGMVKGIIDDAIEAAGGAGWRKYLDTYSKASQENFASRAWFPSVAPVRVGTAHVY